MEQITREEMIGLLSRVDKAMSHPYHDENTIQDVRRAVTALQAAEPVAEVIHNFVGVDMAWCVPPSSGRPPVGTKLFTLPISSTKAHVSEYGDAYQGAREDLAIWKRRALEAEASVRHKDQIIDRLTSELQGDTRFGEPSLPAKAQVPDDLQSIIRELEYAAYNLCGESSLKNIDRVVESTCPEVTLRVAIRNLKALTASPAPNNDKDGCTCQGCGIIYTADLIVPDEWWEKIKPEGKAEGSGLLCPTCIMDRLVEKGWSAGHIASPAPDHNGDGNEMVEELTDAAQEVLAWAETLRGIEVCGTKTGLSLDRLKAAIDAYHQQEEAER